MIRPDRMSGLRVLIFDVDGTLVDSAPGVVAAVGAAYRVLGRPAPDAGLIRAGIGLSVPKFFDHLSAGNDAALLIGRFRHHYRTKREAEGSVVTSPLYAGAREALIRLGSDAGTLLAVATGKSRRGMSALIADHALDGIFVSVQTADTHPSKPHPSMVRTILQETGVVPAQVAMLGDTRYDMAMARAAGVAALGAAWGYHPATSLDADRIVTSFGALDAAFDVVTGQGAA